MSHPPDVTTGAHMKPIPLGSKIYEQVLDDLRHDSSLPSSPASSSASSTSSSLSLPSENYCITAKAELRGHESDVGRTLDPCFRSDVYQGQGRDLSEGSVGRGRCGVSWQCEVGSDLPDLSDPRAGTAHGRGQHARGQGSGEAGGWVSARDEGHGPCFRGAVEEVTLGDLTRSHSDMGHSSSLPHHKPDPLGAGDEHALPQPHPRHSHHHHPHPHLQPDAHSSSASCKRLSSSPSTAAHHHHKDKGKEAASGGLPSAGASRHVNGSKNLCSSNVHAVPGHVVSWSLSSGFQDQSKNFTSWDGLKDLESPSDRPHPPLSRLYPRGPPTDKQPSPIPSRRKTGEWNEALKDCAAEPRSGYAPSRPGDHRRGDGGREEEGAGDVKGAAGRTLSPGWEHAQRSKSRSLSPGGEPSLEPSLLTTKSAGSSSNRSPTRSPLLQRSGHEPSGGRHGACSRTLSTPSPAHLPATHGTRSPNQHVRLCSFRPEDVGERTDTCADDFYLLSDTFRPRAMSDISVHASRRRQLPQPPLQKLGGMMHGQEDHVHVHWADEEGGSSLATSVQLSRIRPRALSHGSADLPRKPILKKPLGT